MVHPHSLKGMQPPQHYANETIKNHISNFKTFTSDTPKV